MSEEIHIYQRRSKKKGYRKLAGPFSNRQAARQWCRRRAYNGPYHIRLADGTYEPFQWNGTTLKVIAP